MKEFTRFHAFAGPIFVLVLTVFLLLSGCQPKAAPVPANPTVSFTGESCVYSGPNEIKTGENSITLQNQDKARTTYAIAILTLYEGKTMDDLKTWTSTDKPSWSELVDYSEIGGGETKSFTANIKHGPVYIVCFSRPPEKYLGPAAAIKILP